MAPLSRWLAWTPPSLHAQYRPQLDGLRAIAVLLVLYAHFWNDDSTAGLLGVRLFFVLSGYLITGILLDAKATGGAHLVHFYARRALRLWPAYFLVIALAVLVNAEGIRDVVWWHVLYGTNFLFVLRDGYVPWYTAAWWSLSVEEQFYLIWPVAVLAVPRFHLPLLCFVLVAVSLVFSLSIELSHGDDQLYGLLPAVLDSLAAGAVVAAWARDRPAMLDRLPLAGFAGLILWIAVVILQLEWTTIASLPLLLVLPAIVHLAGSGSRWRPGKLLALQPLTYLGRISYGIYLYHLPLWWVAMQLTDHWRVSHRGPLLFVGMTVVTIAVSSASWFLLEAPANRLKRHVPYP